jgi:hypothetical protein
MNFWALARLGSEAALGDGTLGRFVWSERLCLDPNYFARLGCANTSRCPFKSITSNSVIP